MEQLPKKSPILAFFMLTIMFGLLLSSILNESAIVDELAHIPAGYSYAVLSDYRLNPEHPPLLKAISGVFVRTFVNPHFPTDIASWKDEINGQWGMGYSFLYENGNDADAIIFWARIPIILLAIYFGWLFYQWIQRRFGSRVALLTLAFFCFSPTMLAHSRYVTTDLGASFGFFIGIATFIQLLERPTLRNAIIAGLCFAVAQLLKFSLVLLVTICGLMFIC
ncbi:MAG: glycosyltransferase family 39 protein, partial [Aquabacterium sp.]|uniref:ArnT family glycosyltransferase n=1 Tax=Aquabacterium sp. TaxID=1872578 RepID=UPI003BB0761F